MDRFQKNSHRTDHSGSSRESEGRGDNVRYGNITTSGNSSPSFFGNIRATNFHYNNAPPNPSPPPQSYSETPQQLEDGNSVAAIGAQLHHAVSRGTKASLLVNTIYRFEDALISEKRRKGVKGQPANPQNSYVKFYCEGHLQTDPVDSRAWDSMMSALKKSMEGLTLVTPGLPNKDELFGGFEADSLRDVSLG